MKLYKNYTAAFKASKNGLVLKIGNFYIVGDLQQITQIELIDKGSYVGQVTLAHLNRLGNANHAAPHISWYNHVPRINWSEKENLKKI